MRKNQRSISIHFASTKRAVPAQSSLKYLKFVNNHASASSPPTTFLSDFNVGAHPEKAFESLRHFIWLYLQPYLPNMFSSVLKLTLVKGLEIIQ